MGRGCCVLVAAAVRRPALPHGGVRAHGCYAAATRARHKFHGEVWFLCGGDGAPSGHRSGEGIGASQEGEGEHKRLGEHLQREATVAEGRGRWIHWLRR